MPLLVWIFNTVVWIVLCSNGLSWWWFVTWLVASVVIVIITQL